MFKFKLSTKTVVFLALFVAIEIVLARFLSISAWNIRIGFSFIPVALAAMIYGPVAAGIVGALGDFLGAILFPTGPYFPGFTLTAFLMGFVFGIFIYKKRTTVRIILACAINQFILGLFLNTLWISVLYGSPYGPLILTRLVQCVILFGVQFVIIRLLDPVLNRIGKGTFREEGIPNHVTQKSDIHGS